jgi:excisionase family DNA binding protein
MGDALMNTRPLTPELVAHRWGVSANTVRSLIAQKKLRAFRVGRLYRIPADAVLEYERSREDAPCQTTGSDGSKDVTSSHGGRTESEGAIVLTLPPSLTPSAKR